MSDDDFQLNARGGWAKRRAGCYPFRQFFTGSRILRSRD